MFKIITLLTLCAACLFFAFLASDQALGDNLDPLAALLQEEANSGPSIESQAIEDSKIEEVQEAELVLMVDPRWSRLITTKKPITRLAITNPNIAEIVQTSPKQFEVIGLQLGETIMTLWCGDVSLRYLVRVALPEQEEE